MERKGCFPLIQSETVGKMVERGRKGKVCRVDRLVRRQPTLAHSHLVSGRVCCIAPLSLDIKKLVLMEQHQWQQAAQPATGLELDGSQIALQRVNALQYLGFA